mmetsp:Transcript_80622/g.215222  ORF Transcript_80622/g.215222 Transcript_80622/m.215222 type:complete len:236 (+) Transcript_80622:179-886(+)
MLISTKLLQLTLSGCLTVRSLPSSHLLPPLFFLQGRLSLPLRQHDFLPPSFLRLQALLFLSLCRFLLRPLSHFLRGNLQFAQPPCIHSLCASRSGLLRHPVKPTTALQFCQRQCLSLALLIQSRLLCCFPLGLQTALAFCNLSRPFLLDFSSPLHVGLARQLLCVANREGSLNRRFPLTRCGFLGSTASGHLRRSLCTSFLLLRKLFASARGRYLLLLAPHRLAPFFFFLRILHT